MTETRNARRPRGEHTQRERVWLAIRAAVEGKPRKRFTRKELLQHLDDVGEVTAETMTKALQLLKRDGVIVRVGTAEADQRFAVYRLADDAAEFPESISTRVLAWRQQVWNALRIQRTATVPAIQSTFYEVDPAPDTVYRYLRRLEKTGYVRRAGRAGPEGQVMSHLRWRLVRDTGPDAPTRKQLNKETREQENEADA